MLMSSPPGVQTGRLISEGPLSRSSQTLPSFKSAVDAISEDGANGPSRHRNRSRRHAGATLKSMRLTWRRPERSAAR
ncbi:hypothetical protein SKAU_G00046930 [Synaphobranchus kaupii]|uniref:Uncharacterized protein n=1 Tax=Synaphobranchus kaupii TaxID=118154 RepID=A0A9Q1G327_SYNKA|nr:hypothetical protein SKAU_G00046930 [Synaphobranchus kaupii]